MSNNSRGSTDRVKKLREQSENTAPSISPERALLVTEIYKKDAGRGAAPLLRAQVFKHLMENKQVCINEGELIVGERGTGPQVAPTYPELCCHTLEDLSVISERKKISFQVSNDVKRIQQEKIIPYWQGRSMRDRIFAQVSREWLDCYAAGIFTEFMEQRAPGHTVADGKIYKTGMLDMIARINEKLEHPAAGQDTLDSQAQEQLKAMAICAEAIITFAGRYAAEAEALVTRETDEARKKELLEIATVCRHVPAHPPRNLWEALQYYWFVHLGVITELNTWDAFCPGRLDQHLEPFYAQGLAAGTLNRDQAKELLECFWIKFNNQPAPPKVGITLKESGTYTDFANINLGGVKVDGTDGVNDVTYLLLEVIDQMRLVQPSTNVQVSKKNPDFFVRKAGEVIRKGWGQPSVFNVEAVIQELLVQGKTLTDARCGGTSGCVETGAFGKESYILTGYFNLTKVLEITLHDGLDPRTGKIIGIGQGKLKRFDTFEELLEAYERQLRHFIDIKLAGNQVIEELYAETMPAPFLSLIIDDCLEKAKDYNAGGARYNTNYIQGVGIGSITDCLSALKKHVFEDQRFTLTDLLALMKNNFSGTEHLRQLLINKTPHYGNDDDDADDIMKNIFTMFHRLVDGRRSYRGGTYRINMLPTTCHVYFGSVIGAMPDGRLSGMPLSEGISPVQGVDLNGPTAVIKSAAKMDHLLTGGTLLNLKFTPQVLEGETGLESLVRLIRAYFRMDGHHIQFNVIDAKTLSDAQQNPEQHRDLIVRVAGYSDYFNNLSEQLQNEIIRRTEHQSF